MNDQAKIQRILRLFMLLAGKRWYSAAIIQERIGVSTRTLYRYIHTLETAGFVVERHPRQGYRLALDVPGVKNTARLLHFTEQEAYLLYKTLGLLQGEGPAKERLLRKLHTLYDCHILAQPAQQHTLEIVATLQKAMDNKLQCIIGRYRSNHTQTIRDRLIEPFAFTENYESVWGYEVDSGCCKQYKIARMEGIALLSYPWMLEELHTIPFTDAFGFAAPALIGTAHLRMSMRAANLLMEEYPLTEKYIRETDTEFFAEIPFADYKGIGRFIRGLPREIEVVGPDGLKKYMEG